MQQKAIRHVILMMQGDVIELLPTMPGIETVGVLTAGTAAMPK